MRGTIAAALRVRGDGPVPEEAPVPFTLLVLLVAIGLSYARGGRLARIADAELRTTWLLFAGLVLQLGVDVAAGRELIADAGAVGSSLLVASQVLIVAWLIRNRRLPGIWLVAAGLALNAIVMTANGAMPVHPDAMRALGLGELQVPPGKHTLLTDATLFPWLADIIPLRPLRTIISVGDVVLAVGLIPMTHALMTWPRPDGVRRSPPADRAPA